MQRRKILLLIKGLGLGGAERLLVDSIPYLDRARFDYHVAYLLPWKGTLAPHFRAQQLPIYCLGQGETATQLHQDGPTMSAAAASPSVTLPRSWSAVTLLPRAYAQLVRLQRREQFDLIHADLPVAGALARIFGHRHGVPVVYTEHNLQDRCHPLSRRLNSATYKWNTYVLAVSDEVNRSLVQAGLNKKTTIATLRNGVPVAQVRAEATNLDSLRAELQISGDHLIVGTVAVFRQQKRLDDWLHVAQQVVAQRQDVTFLLVGDGPEMPTVKREIIARGLQDHVCLPGFREDGRRLLGLIDIYLMTSAFEGLPIALLEAMALAKPIVATAVGGIPEAVTHGQEGWLTAVGEIEQMAGHLLTLLADRHAQRQMGERGAQKIDEHFHIEQRVRAIEEVYEKVLALRPQTKPDLVSVLSIDS